MKTTAKKTNQKDEHQPGWKPWQKGDPVTVNRIVWGQPELDHINDVYEADWFGPGRKVTEFAHALTQLTGHTFALPVNSGSSALLLAVRSLIEMGLWKSGDAIIHPALTFPTSIAPAIQCGLEPVFVDVDPNTYQIDLNQLERAIDTYGLNHIGGAIIPHILGNINDIDRIKVMLNDKPIIEDCCDTLGGRYKGRHVGQAGTVAAFSFYGSHHITTAGVGGALLTDNDLVFDLSRSMAYWGRTDYSLLEDSYDRFAKRYWYDTVGYDLQMTEIQAAFGLGQLTRFSEANDLRATRWQQVAGYFRQYADWLTLPRQACADSEPSWFAFPITIKPDAPFTRLGLATHLISHKIEIRPIFTGDITKHPAFRQYRGNVFDGPGAPIAEYIGEAGLFLPSWGMSDGELEYMLGVLEVFFDRF